LSLFQIGNSNPIPQTRAKWNLGATQRNPPPGIAPHPPVATRVPLQHEHTIVPHQVVLRFVWCTVYTHRAVAHRNCRYNFPRHTTHTNFAALHWRNNMRTVEGNYNLAMQVAHHCPHPVDLAIWPLGTFQTPPSPTSFQCQTPGTVLAPLSLMRHWEHTDASPHLSLCSIKKSQKSKKVTARTCTVDITLHTLASSCVCCCTTTSTPFLSRERADTAYIKTTARCVAKGSAEVTLNKHWCKGTILSCCAC
jgi:hypothetical protein